GGTRPCRSPGLTISPSISYHFLYREMRCADRVYFPQHLWRTMMHFTSLLRFRRLGGLALVAGSLILPARAAQETELKDETGRVILKYVIEVPSVIAAAGTTDPAKQVGLILCSQEHDTPTGNDIFPVRQSLLRQGLIDKYVLLAPAPQGRKFGPVDHEPIEKLIAWAKKTYPINPRRVYMYGKGE